MIVAGIITPAEAAGALGISLQAVHKWTDPARAKQARAMFAATIIEEFVNPNAKAGSMSKGQMRRLHDQIVSNFADPI